MDRALNVRFVAGARVVERAVGAGPWTAHVLSGPVDGRAVVRYESAGGAAIIGKFYPDDTGARVQQVTADLVARTAGAAARTLHIAAPRGYDPGLRLLLQDPVAGTRLDAGALDLAAIARAGTALGELHGLPPGAGPAKTLADHLRELSQPLPTALASDRPQYRARIESALVRMAAAENAWSGTQCVPLHRDYRLRRLFADGTRIHVLDWERFASGDPTFDVACFTTCLRIHHEPAAAEPAIEAFLQAYGAERTIPDLGLRMPAYEAFHYMLRACRRYRMREPGAEFDIQKLMARLEQVRW